MISFYIVSALLLHFKISTIVSEGCTSDFFLNIASINEDFLK